MPNSSACWRLPPKSLSHWLHTQHLRGSLSPATSQPNPGRCSDSLGGSGPLVEQAEHGRGADQLVTGRSDLERRLVDNGGKGPGPLPYRSGCEHQTMCAHAEPAPLFS
jgi:hypothetical protein